MIARRAEVVKKREMKRRTANRPKHGRGGKKLAWIQTPGGQSHAVEKVKGKLGAIARGVMWGPRD